MSSYIHFTEEQKQRAAAVDLEEFLLVVFLIAMTLIMGIQVLSRYVHGMTMRRSEADMPSALCSGSTALATRTQ